MSLTDNWLTRTFGGTGAGLSTYLDFLALQAQFLATGTEKFGKFVPGLNRLTAIPTAAAIDRLGASLEHLAEMVRNGQRVNGINQSVIDMNDRMKAFRARISLDELARSVQGLMQGEQPAPALTHA